MIYFSVVILTKWTKLRDDIFSNNLAKGSLITSLNGINSKEILDSKYYTYWTTKGKDTAAVIELKLKNKSTFNVLMLQENIAVGQRIEKFELDYRDGNDWKKATEGTTVGYKRLLQFEPVTTDKVRLKIISSRLNPTIAEMGLYFQSDVEKD